MTTIFITKLSIYLTLVSANPTIHIDQSKVIEYLNNDDANETSLELIPSNSLVRL